jgi:hypothetical protein
MLFNFHNFLHALRQVKVSRGIQSKGKRKSSSSAVDTLMHGKKKNLDATLMLHCSDTGYRTVLQAACSNNNCSRVWFDGSSSPRLFVFRLCALRNSRLDDYTRFQRSMMKQLTGNAVRRQ